MNRTRTRFDCRACVAPVLAAGLLAAATAPLAGAPAGNDADLVSQLDGYLQSVYPADEPGAAVIVVRDGEILHRAAYGMADLELGVPLEPGMVFRLASLTKQFTAAAILLLEERGALSIDDPITKYLPDYPTHGHEITIAHLVAHTSGIRNRTEIPGWREKIRDDVSVGELIDSFKNEPMDFAPGEEHRYNNSGYVLLGAVIEKASGESYARFIEENIFEPLGMSASFYGDHDRIIPRRVSGYQGGPGEYRNGEYLSVSQAYAAGALLSTVDDLAKWDAALYTDSLLSAPSRAKQVVPFELKDGESTGYAYGVRIGKLRGRPAVQHGGDGPVSSTWALRLPEERVYVAVLSNGADRPTRPQYVAAKLAAMAIGDPFPERKAIELDEAILERYVGVYRISPEETRSVTLVDGQLYSQRTGRRRRPIRPESEALFFYDHNFTYLTFERDDAGRVTHMLRYPGGSGPGQREDLESR